jgi:enoyl-CoA hydratase
LEYIIYEKRGYVGILTLSRQKQLNAINRAMLTELDESIKAIREDKELRCLVITGAGEKAFAAGADISEMKNMTPEEAKNFGTLGSGIMRSIELLEIPVIAAVIFALLPKTRFSGSRR